MCLLPNFAPKDFTKFAQSRKADSKRTSGPAELVVSDCALVASA
jgi:hypothetical protein